MVEKTLYTFIFIALQLCLYGQGLNTFDNLLSYKFTTSDSLQILLLEAQKSHLEKDKGIRLNSSAGTNEFGDLESGNIFRVKAGLEWNLLDEGWRDRKLSSKVLELKKEIQKQETIQEGPGKNYVHLYNHILYCFNKEKLKYLLEKEYLINILTKRYEALYHAHATDFQHLLSIYEKSDEVSILKLGIENFNRFYEKNLAQNAPILVPAYLPILQIDIDKIYSHQEQDTLFDYIRTIKLEKNRIENKLSNQKRLAVYNNLYWRPLQAPGTSRYFYNGFGVRFSTAIAPRKKSGNKILDIQDQIDIQKYEELKFNNQKELSNFLLEYHSKLRLYNRYLYKQKELNEDQRIEQAVKLVNYSDPQSDLKSMLIDLERLTGVYEMLDLKQHLYFLLLKIYSVSNVSSILPYVEEIGTASKKKLKGDRLLLLKGIFSNEVEHNFIKEYILKNEFFNVIIEDNVPQNNALRNLLIKSQIRVFDNINAFNYRPIIKVPIFNFKERTEMEYWIEDHYQKNKDFIFLIENMNQLIKIDSVVLE